MSQKETVVRFMIIVKASAESEAGVMPEQRVFDAMADYHVELKKAGVLLAATGLQPTSKGFRIKYLRQQALLR